MPHEAIKRGSRVSRDAGERAVSPKAAVAATADTNVEVLGDRVRCDVRYQELKIPPTEYQAFKRKCMGDKYSDDD